MRVAVVGAGWYGCHIASELISDGHQVTIFEAQGDIFNGASGINQHRLHLGFHYPRSFPTREQSRDGFKKFREKYPELSTSIATNLYAIAKEHSYLDFETYQQVMIASGLDFKLQKPADYGLVGMAGAITCDERLVSTNKAREHFRESLQYHLSLNDPVRSIEPIKSGVRVNGTDFDAAVSCTCGQLEQYKNVSMSYESCLVLLYKGPQDHPALTVMDGPFFSIYPYENDLFTLTSVTHTPLKIHDSFGEAQNYLDNLPSGLIEEKFKLFEAETIAYYPSFPDKFEFVETQTIVKTKPSNRSDTRVCRVEESDTRVIEVIAGKIDSIFFAAERVEQLLEQYR